MGGGFEKKKKKKKKLEIPLTFIFKNPLVSKVPLIWRERGALEGKGLILSLNTYKLGKLCSFYFLRTINHRNNNK